jgi:RNA polymerase sigma-70 factor (ECF subfamily)
MHLTFDEIYTRYYQKSLLFVKSYVRDGMAAEDIVSEAMIRLWGRVRTGTVDAVPALLLSMLRNASLNYLKHQAVRQEAMTRMASWMESDLKYRIDTLEACNPEEIYSSEIARIVEQTLSSLPPRTRRIFEMHRYEARPVKEIAGVLAMRPKAIEYHFTRALKALRTALVDYFPLLWLVFLNC